MKRAAEMLWFFGVLAVVLVPTAVEVLFCIITRRELEPGKRLTPPY